jgi:nitrile hydratase beta subunit
VGAISDMGGRREHYARIVREDDEPVFHERWEARVFGMSGLIMLLLRGNTERFRFAMEQLPREEYLAGYYQRWLGGLERLLVEAGYLRQGELDAGLAHRARAAHPVRVRSRARLALASRLVRSYLRPRLPRWVCAHVLPRVTGTARRSARPPRFAAGDRVRVRSGPERAFTRKPGYVRGKPGVISAHQRAALFADDRGEGRRARPEHLYTVAFDGRDLWGGDAEPRTEVRVDLFESHLEPA